MPFFANTPESLIGRTDSKNPSTTCRGITSSGRPCRRPIAAATVPPPRSKAGGLRVDDPQDERLYCWQHKEQASLSARSSPGPKTSTTPILEERTSLDTLADRLGIVAQAQGRKSSKQYQQSGRPSGGHGEKQQRPAKMARPKTKKTVEFCCCFRIPIEEVQPPSRPMPRPLQQQPSASAPVTPIGNNGRRVSGQQHLAPPSSPSPSGPRQSLPGGTHTSSMTGRSSRRHSSAASQTSQTATLFALIPPSASPQTASLLMAELAKPISQLDEPGYIYVFWLTPESQPSAPPAEAARSLLAPPPGPTTPTKRPGGQRRPSDVLASFAASSPTGGGKQKKKVLLKIGRATNVQRRLNEWTRQCGYNLSLIRYYPYIPSSGGGGSPASAGSPGQQPRKMPHSHRVERLVHLELAGRGLRVADREKCGACGREHREWFEVNATRAAVADVDEVVRRWVEWDEGMG